MIQKLSRRRIVIILVLALIFLCVIVASLSSDGTDGTTPSGTEVAEEQPSVDVSTPTTEPSKAPTTTPEPTDTPFPTVTNTPPPEPIILTGSGDDVIEVEKWSDAALLKISYQGGGNFAVWSYGADNEPIDLLVNTIGSYEGTRPLDFLEGELTTRFQIESSGQWEFTILPLSEIRTEKIPGTILGVGDDVILLDGEPDLLKIDASTAESNFIVWGYGNYSDLLVNEIAPYTGVVIAGNDVLILVIEAEGEWSIEVTE